MVKGSPSGRKCDPVPEVNTGDVDPMSQFANQVSLPLCRQIKDGFYWCSRVAGHVEGHPVRSHPAVRHVATDQNFVALEVW